MWICLWRFFSELLRNVSSKLSNYPMSTSVVHPFTRILLRSQPKSKQTYTKHYEIFDGRKKALQEKVIYFWNFSDFISITVAVFDAHNKPKIPNFFYPKVQCLHLKLTSSVFLKRYYFKSIPKNTTHLLCVTCNAYDVL